MAIRHDAAYALAMGMISPAQMARVQQETYQYRREMAYRGLNPCMDPGSLFDSQTKVPLPPPAKPRSKKLLLLEM